MKKASILAVIILASCGDNLDPGLRVDTWRDAEDVWAEAWCSYQTRCHPDSLATLYDSHEECVVDVRSDNCSFRENTSFPDCDEPFPQIHLDEMQQCSDEMSELDCGATQAPDVCFVAFSESK